MLVLLGDAFPIEKVLAIRSMGIKTAVWFTDDPYYTDVTSSIAPYYHYVFTQEINCVSYYQILGCPQSALFTSLLSNTKVFVNQQNKEENEKSIDVCFMGAGWNNRIILFDEIERISFKKEYVNCRKILE